MKIEIDLMQVQATPDVARALVVAGLCALPQDEAELAVAEWQAVLGVRTADEDGKLGAINIPFDSDVSRETSGVTAAEQSPKSAASEPSEGDPAALGADTPLAYAGLSAKTVGALTRAGFETLGDVTTKTGDWLTANVDRFGKGALAEVETAMSSAGLSLGVEEAPTPAAATTPQPEPAVIPQRDLELPQQGNGTDLAGLDTRALVRRAEHAIGREKVWDIFKQHGVSKLVALGDKEPAFRTSLIEAMAS